VDSSVGSKTGINNQFGKNMVGAFHHPRAVFADVGVLKTLESREVRSGYYELIKHGAIGGFSLFGKTKAFLDNYPLGSFSDYFGDDDFESALIDLISDQISQKASVVSQDQHEDIYRADSASRKVLNFGHTVGHALERATGYDFFRHGEAVGYGMLAALEIGKRLEISDEVSINLLNDVVVGVGGLPDTSDIDVESVFNAIEYDKKSAGKSVQWVLLESIGVPRIMSGEIVPSSIVRESLKWILHK
jgi:3-dehydroquinate synthase